MTVPSRQLASWIALVAGWLALLVALHAPSRLTLEVAAEAGAVEALGPHVDPASAEGPVGDTREAVAESEGEGPPPGRRAVLPVVAVVSHLFSDALRARRAARVAVVRVPRPTPTPRVVWYALAPAPARAPPALFAVA